MYLAVAALLRLSSIRFSKPTVMKKTKSNPTATMLVISMGFLVIYIASKQNWALIVSLSAGLIGILSPWLSKKIDFLWMKLTYVLSLIVPNILLSAVFYVFLFPLALLSKLFSKKDTLQLRNTGTTFVTINRDFDKASFERPW